MNHSFVARNTRTHRFGIPPLTAAVAAAIGSGFAGTHVHAQDRATVEEIVVTASRRATTVQELPFNIAALSGDTLERQRLTTLPEFSRWVPGLTVVDQGPRASNLMTVRGLNVLSLNDPEFLDNGSGDTVQTYLGDIPLYMDLKLHDIERVEVLLGPQGTLYGAGTLGGAVRYIPRAPDPTELTFDVHGDLYGVSHSDGTGHQTDVAVNVPLIENKLALRASIASFDDPGFIDYPFVVREPGVSNPQPDFDDPADVAANLRRVDDANWEETLSGRVSMLWNVGDRVQTTFSYYFQDQETGARTVNHRHAFDTGKYESGLRFLEPNDRKNRLFTADVVADLGFAELTSATGVSEFDRLGQRDQTDLLLDGFGYDDFPSFAAYTREQVAEERFNQEIRLVSTGAGPWSWIGGLFYNAFELDATSAEFTPGYFDFHDLDFATGDLEYMKTTHGELTEQAVFGEVSYRFADRWAVTLGGRHFEYDIEQFVSVNMPRWAQYAEPPLEVSDSGFLGKLNLAFDVTDNSLAYMTISEGYRTGGANSIELCPSEIPDGQISCTLPHEKLIKPDVTTNYEVGVHNTWQDGRTNFNAALFYIDWNDIQTQSTTQYGSEPITINGGGARSRGLELSMQTSTIGPWSFGATYAYTDAELTTDAAGLVDGESAFAGDRLSGTPEHQGSFHVGYYRQLPNGMDLDVAYGVTVTSDVLTKVGLRSNGETLGGYSVHNASAGIGRESWTATLYADNLFDKFAETGVRLDPSYIRDINGFTLRRYFRNVLRPRTFGIEFRYRL